jgi:hypothetical protein
MLLAAILLLSPIAQNWDAAKLAMSPNAVFSTNPGYDFATSSPPSEPLANAPEPKVKTDAELATESGAGVDGVLIEPVPVVQPGGAPINASPMKPFARSRETPTQRKLWYALAFTGSGAAAFDAWSTRRAITTGYGVEGNPLLRPFSHSGALYAATQVSPLLMDFIGKRMMTSRYGLLRKSWWIPQVAGTGVSLAAGVHNIELVP